MQKVARSRFEVDDCISVISAVTLPRHPKSLQDEQNHVKSMIREMDALLSKKSLNINPMCFVTPFWFAYYHLDLRIVMQKWVGLHFHAFPQLKWSIPARQLNRKLPKTRLRLGIVSSDFKNRYSSIYGCFGGTIDLLPRDIFEIVFMAYAD